MTNVRCRDGETIILGGLFRESTTITRNQVPFLGDIPLLGNAFRGQDDTVVKEEIIFLLTPSILPDEQLWEAGKDSLEIVKAVRIGARSGLLPFSQDKITANYNLDALDAYREGDLDNAHSIGLTYPYVLLSMQPEMIRLREHITNEQESSWERDLLHDLMLKEQENVQATVEVEQ